MKTNQKGFTLIELLVVIAIIGLLSTLSIVALNTARARSRDARRVSDVKQVQTALEMYYNEMNTYPTTASISTTSPIKGTGASSTYMTLFPTAPLPVDGGCTAANNQYVYTQTDAGASYTLTYCLGGATGNITTGAHTATPASIQTQ
jgi:prepilin-type N-terminal cleavage/methylation domain-containing protein